MSSADKPCRRLFGNITAPNARPHRVANICPCPICLSGVGRDICPRGYASIGSCFLLEMSKSESHRCDGRKTSLGQQLLAVSEPGFDVEETGYTQNHQHQQCHDG